MNLSTINGRKVFLGTGCKIAELFPIVILHVNMHKDKSAYIFEGSSIILRDVLREWQRNYENDKAMIFRLHYMHQ